MMGAWIRKVPVLKGEITRLLALIQCRFGVDYWEEVISFHAIRWLGRGLCGWAYRYRLWLRAFRRSSAGGHCGNGRHLQPAWQPPLAAAWISGRTTRRAFGSITE